MECEYYFMCKCGVRDYISVVMFGEPNLDYV